MHRYVFASLSEIAFSARPLQLEGKGPTLSSRVRAREPLSRSTAARERGSRIPSMTATYASKGACQRARAQRAPAARRKPPRAPRTRSFWLLIAAVAVAALAVIGVVSQLNSVALDIEPKDARVHVPGTLLSIHTGGHLLLLPGQHVIR